MIRRVAACLILICAFLPFAASADQTVPEAPVGSALGDAPRASLLWPATYRAIFRVPRTPTPLYVGGSWLIRDLTVTIAYPGGRRETIVATPTLPGHILGVQLPADASQADRIELTAVAVSASRPPFLVSADQLAALAWSAWSDIALFGVVLALAVLFGAFARLYRTRAWGWYAAAMAGQALLLIPRLGVMRPPPELTQPLHAALEILVAVALARMTLNYARTALDTPVAPRIVRALWLLVAIVAVNAAGTAVLQDLWPLPDILARILTIALQCTLVAIAVLAQRRSIPGASFFVAATAAGALGTFLGVVAYAVNDNVLAAFGTAGTAIEALLLALALSVRIIEHARERPRLLAAARIDAVTGIANRDVLNECLHVLTMHAHRTRAPLAALAVDVDQFRSYVIAYGRAAADDVLRSIANALVRTASRNDDVVARYDGDVFVVVLPGTDLGAAEGFARAILAEVAALAIAHHSTPTRRLTVSVGAATMVAPAVSAEALLARAERALFVAKAMGRNRVVVDEPDPPLLGAPPTAFAGRRASSDVI